MPSARSTTAMRPSSPLSPRHEGTQSFQQSRSQAYQSRPSSQSQRRQFGNNLMLPGLPRFHPANYPSAHSSLASTPHTGPNSPHAPASPSLQQKMIHEAQRSLNAYAVRSPTSQLTGQPDSPKLQPLGSPGPVTPLELETAEGYISAGKQAPRSVINDHSEELSQKLAQAARQRENTTRATSGPLRAH